MVTTIFNGLRLLSEHKGTTSVSHGFTVYHLKVPTDVSFEAQITYGVLSLLSFSRSQICIDAALVKPCAGTLTCNKQNMFLH